MEYRKLGKEGPLVSRLGFGCMGISEYYGPGDEKEGKEVIQEAFQKGINFFDTADMYGEGHNETVVGKALRPFRHKVVLATKCGIEGKGEQMRINNDPAYIKKACEGSLKRLGVDVIDLYYLHRYKKEIPLEASMGAMQELLQEGKIRFVGLSEVDGEVLEKAHHILQNKLVAIQSEYSLLNRASAEIVLPTCRKWGISFVSFSPIARGLLSGNFRDDKTFKQGSAFDLRGIMPQFQGEALKANLKLVDAVSEMARQKKCTPAQLALAWLFAQGDDLIPIPGTKRIHYLHENIAALDIHLTDEELTLLDQIMKRHPAQGTRYPEKVLQEVFLKF